MPFGKDEKETEDKTKDAKRNVKIDMLKSKGYSERDAILKGAADDVPSEDEVEPSEEMSDGEIDHLGSEMEDGTTIELSESDLGEAPEVGSTVKLDAKVMGVHLKDDGSKCYELLISAGSGSGELDTEDVSENEV